MAKTKHEQIDWALELAPEYVPSPPQLEIYLTSSDGSHMSTRPTRKLVIHLAYLATREEKLWRISPSS